jgi:serine protease AprX
MTRPYSFDPKPQIHPRGRKLPHRLVGILAALALCLVTGPTVVEGYLAESVGADVAHDGGTTGLGVTIAVIVATDESSLPVPPAADGHDRLLDVVTMAPSPTAGSLDGEPVYADNSPCNRLEAMLSGRRDAAGRYQGVAPNADLVLVKVPSHGSEPGSQGAWRAIDWVVANSERYGIRVLSLPLTVGPTAPELEQAIRRAWLAGIVVVVPAGDGVTGTIAGVGRLLEAITVGAVVEAEEGWRVPSYSAAGSTPAGFIKPEIVAPAALAPAASPTAGATVHSIGGTSTSAAVVSGVAALLLEEIPWLTPAEVKLRLMATARAVTVVADETRPPRRQGAGKVDAARALGQVSSEPDSRQAGRGLLWSDRSGRGFLWSDGSYAAIGEDGGPMAEIPLGAEASRGLLWSD